MQLVVVDVWSIVRLCSVCVGSVCGCGGVVVWSGEVGVSCLLVDALFM